MTSSVPAVSADWRRGLPLLSGKTATVREPRLSDAPSLFAMLTPDVARFISPPPTTLDGFERFITRSHLDREEGRVVCFAVVPTGADVAVGVIQVRQIEPGFAAAEWGFAIGAAYWGTGLFVDAANLVMEFAFESLGVHRLEARAVVANGRGNAALRKLGAVREGLLRRSFRKNGQAFDQILWCVLDGDWMSNRWRRSIHVS